MAFVIRGGYRRKECFDPTAPTARFAFHGASLALIGWISLAFGGRHYSAALDEGLRHGLLAAIWGLPDERQRPIMCDRNPIQAMRPPASLSSELSDLVVIQSESFSMFVDFISGGAPRCS